MPGLIVPRRDPLIAMRGHGAVEIFDERTGKLVQRELFENFITNETKKYMKWMARKVFWAGISGSYSDQSNRLGGDSNANYAIPGPWRLFGPPMNDTEPFYSMTHIAATTNTEAEDPTNETYSRGQIIAWANKATYVGADTKRGSQNLVECSADGTKTKWVFDWPTNAGNGTFQSISWLAINEDTTPAGLYPNGWLRKALDIPTPDFGTVGTPYTTSFHGSNHDQDMKFDSDDGNDRFIADIYDPVTNHHRIWHANWDSTGWTLMFDRNPTGVGSGPIAVAGANIYLAAYDPSANPCLVKVNTAGAVLATVANTWNTLLGVASANIRDLAWDGTNLWVVANSGSLKKAWKINPATGAVISSIDVSAYMDTPTSIAIDPTGDIWVGDSYSISRFTAGGVFKARLSGVFNTYDFYALAWRNSGGENTLYASNYNGPMLIRKLALNNLGARTLLGAPVTKAATQTMKITYEFDFS